MKLNSYYFSLLLYVFCWKISQRMSFFVHWKFYLWLKKNKKIKKKWSSLIQWTFKNIIKIPCNRALEGIIGMSELRKYTCAVSPIPYAERSATHAPFLRSRRAAEVFKFVSAPLSSPRSTLSCLHPLSLSLSLLCVRSICSFSNAVSSRPASLKNERPLLLRDISRAGNIHLLKRG